MTTWKFGDSWVSFGTQRTTGIGGGKMASKQECFIASKTPKASKPKGKRTK